MDVQVDGWRDGIMDGLNQKTKKIRVGILDGRHAQFNVSIYIIIIIFVVVVIYIIIIFVVVVIYIIIIFVVVVIYIIIIFVLLLFICAI